VPEQLAPFLTEGVKAITLSLPIITALREYCIAGLANYGGRAATDYPYFGRSVGLEFLVGPQTA
jgi:hypothetical protein